MKKTVRILALVSIFSLVFIGSNAFAQSHAGSNAFPGDWIRAEVGGAYHPMGWNTYEASWLIGHYVMNPDGIPLGQISNLVIDKANGRIALVVLSDVAGIGGKVVAVPFSSVVRTGENSFQFSLGDRELPMTSGYESSYAYFLTEAPTTSDLYGVSSVIHPDWVAEIYRHYGQVPYWTQKGERPLAAMGLFKSTKLMGVRVQTPRGKEVAEINDLVIDSSNGHIAFLVLSNVRGRGGALVAVPFSALSRHDETFLLNATAKKLEAAPGFDVHADLGNRHWAEHVYKYFGHQPHWTEGGQMMSPARHETPAPAKPMTQNQYYQMYGY